MKIVNLISWNHIRERNRGVPERWTPSIGVRDHICHVFIAEEEMTMGGGKSITGMIGAERTRHRLQGEDVGGEILVFIAIGRQTQISKLQCLEGKLLIADLH